MVEPVFHLFAYGTLMAGKGSPSPVLTGCERVGTGSVRGTLYHTGRYPALLLSGGTPVSGEIWRCPAHVLPRLDQYEAVSEGLFRRVGVRVADVACWAYVAGPALGPRLTPDARASSPPSSPRWTR